VIEEEAEAGLGPAPLEGRWQPAPGDPQGRGLDAGTALVADRRLADLRAMVSRLAEEPHLDRLPPTLDPPGDDRRLDDLVGTLASLAEGVRAGAAVADALEQVGERMAALETTAAQLAEGVRALNERVAPLPQRIGAIAVQVDRLTPGGSPPGRAQSVVFDQEAEDRRLEAVVEVLTGVTRRQDEVAAAIGAVLNQVRGPMGVDAVLGRMEQRERSLAGRLDRIDAELRRSSELPISSSPGSEVGGAERSNSVVEGLVHLSRRQDELGVAMDRRLSAIEAGLNAVTTGGGPTPGPPTSAEVAALRLAELRAERARVQAHLRDERLLAVQAFDDEYIDEDA